MGFLDKADVRELLKDQGLMADVAKAVVEDPEAMDDLAEDIADKLSDELEDDPELKKKIVEAAVASPDFRKRIIRKLVEDLD